MTENFQFLTKNCLEWITDSPYMCGARQSPIFSFLDVDWYLRLDLSTENKCYYLGLHVHNLKKNELLTKRASLTAFVTRNDYKGASAQISRGVAVLKTDKSTVIKEKLRDYYGGLTIHCIFSTDIPSALHINGSKAMHLSSLPALEAQHSSTPNSIVMKAKLAASAPDDSVSGVENLGFDLSRLLDQKYFSDVTLKCGNRSFSAHRSILAARSDVFAAMFQIKMVESQTGIVNISDIDSEVLHMLLKYVYTGKIPDLSVGIATRLYMAANKYSIKSLKNECSKLMLGSLTKENCLEFLLLADACSDVKFKTRLINFIAEILNLIGEPWLKFTEKHPQLAVSVYQRYALITNKCSAP